MEQHSSLLIKPNLQNDHYFLYKGKRFPFNFELLRNCSNFCLRYQDELMQKQEINLINDESQEKIDFSDKVIQDFIFFFQTNQITFDENNVYELNYLAIKYEINKLINETNDFINENSRKIILNFLENNQNLSTYKKAKIEQIISENLMDFISDERLLMLPISSLHHILSLYLFKAQNEHVVDFCFRCLDKFGKEASCLISLLNFNEIDIKYTDLLSTKYSTKFDFNFINITLIISTFKLYISNSKYNKFNNKLFNDIISKYSYIYISNEFNLEKKIIQNLISSNVIMINYYEDESIKNNELHFIIGFRKTVVIIKQSLFPNLQKLFLKKDNLKICFCENIKSIFDENIKKFHLNIEYEELKMNEFFDTEISAFFKEFFNNFSMKSHYIRFINKIKLNISGYLIKQSYYDLNYDRVKDFYSQSKKKIIPREMNQNELIELRIIGCGSLFKAVLTYHIYDEKLYVIKKPNTDEENNAKFLQIETNNYKKIMHPFIPKFYGTININRNNCPVIEFINGKTLSEIDCSRFSISEKFSIIIQLLSVILYLHENNYIYRDIKPNNVIIDQNKTLVLIDFDRMIEDKSINNENNEPHTNDFCSDYYAPEIIYKNFTNKCDIYSIGKMIKKIIHDIENNNYYSMIHPIYFDCINESPAKRPTSSDLIAYIYIFLLRKNITCDFSSIFNHDYTQVQFNLGAIYYLGRYISRDINKAIYYFTLAANQNYPKAQYNLGVIYYEGRYISRDINKSIYYFTLAANQNNKEAQYNLGIIYYDGKYISRDINKAIYYFTLAANQNYPKAQYNLGLIYYLGQYISRDINKSIYYYSLAANQNDPEAQNNLGLIYEVDKYISRDMNKAIYYYSLAANQNNSKAQFNLGAIYSEGKYIPRDMNKSIYYYSLAANQNNTEAQYNLGVIYSEGKYIPRDINKAIYYFTLVANQNHPKAQNNLGVIYSEGQYILRDINKAIYYFTLAANQNHPGAQCNLGYIYYKGEYIPRDINKSIYYYSLAANQNNSKARNNLGVIYSEGKYIPRDINKSIYYYSLAADQNYPEAQNNLGAIYYNGKYISRDINKAIYYFTLAANQNHLEAQYNLGVIYYNDQYISRDINKFIYYFTLAANQNHQQAQYNLGAIYYNGQYISRDINKSIYYYSLSANQKNSQAQYNLGTIYYEGQYISRDINKTIYYFTLAANQNHQQAQYNLGVIYYEGQYISRDINKSIYYYSLAANMNDPKARNNLGAIYYIGKYISRDINKAIYYFTLAANQNNTEAQYNLGAIYYEDQYIPRDINKSIYYYSLAANQNNKEAQYNLGVIYYEDQYISRDINKAIYYYSLAANQNHLEAQYNLGVIYYLGQYISQDINKSIYYFEKAANQNHPYAQYKLGLIYYIGISIKQDIKRGIYWINQSSNNDCIEAHFALGFLYQEGKYIKRNVDESIKFYKKASSFNDQYAKNNLGIIYKNYVEKKYDYTVYFEEAIRQKNDPVSMYNLSHAYIYEYQNEKFINKSIKLLIQSSMLGFVPSNELLCLMIIKKIFNKQINENKIISAINIEQELSEFTDVTSNLKYSIVNIIQKQRLYDQSIFECYYKKYEEIEFIYDLLLIPIQIKDIYNEEKQLKISNSNEEYNITADFYEGFELDININIPEYIQEMRMIRNQILKYIDDGDFQLFIQVMNDKKVKDDKNKLKRILYLIANISKINSNSNLFKKIVTILQYFREDIINYYSNNEIIDIFKSNKHLILYLIEEKIIKINNSFISNPKYHYEYFKPKVKPQIDEGKLLICEEKYEDDMLNFLKDNANNNY